METLLDDDPDIKRAAYNQDVQTLDKPVEESYSTCSAYSIQAFTWTQATEDKTHVGGNARLLSCLPSPTFLLTNIDECAGSFQLAI
jgi:hypothetical protein